MNEKEFIENHPGLKGKEIYVDEFHIGVTPEREIMTRTGIIKEKLAPEPNSFRGRTFEYIEGNVYSKKTIHETQLDKQKALEVIESNDFDIELRLIIIDRSGEDRAILIKRLIKKELGL